MTTRNLGIIAGIDGSPLMKDVCDYSAWLASKTGQKITLLHTLGQSPESDKSVPPFDEGEEELLNEIHALEEQQASLKKQHGKLLLKSAQKHLKRYLDLDVQMLQKRGEFSEALVELENEIKFVVLGKRGKGHAGEEDKVGSKLEVVLRAMHSPALIVPGSFSEPKNCMLAWDGSDSSEKALQLLAGAGLARGMRCHLVCVNREEDSLQRVGRILQDSDFDEVITSHLQGDVAEELARYQQEHAIDITAMGAYSHNKLIGMLLGSFTNKMLLRSKNPLLLVR